MYGIRKGWEDTSVLMRSQQIHSTVIAVYFKNNTNKKTKNKTKQNKKTPKTIEVPDAAVPVAFKEHLKTPPPSEPAMKVVLSSYENDRHVTKR